MADEHLPIRVVKALVRRRRTPPAQELIDPVQRVDVPPTSGAGAHDGDGKAPKQPPVVVVYQQNIHIHNQVANVQAAPAPPVPPAAAAPPLGTPRPRLFRPAVTAELVERARKMRGDGVTLLLRNYYPMVFRLAAALVGGEKAARRVSRMVVKRSLRMMNRWHAPVEAENWFLRNTVQCSRANLGAGGRDDVLAPADRRSADRNAAAFVKALRALPFQQAEAFLLQNGERLENRTVAIAMDCSMTATANHLAAANRTLRQMAGEEFDHQAANLADRYALLEPEAQWVLRELKWPVRRKLAWRRIVRGVKTIICLAVLGGAAWAAWKWKVWTWWGH